MFSRNPLLWLVALPLALSLSGITTVAPVPVPTRTALRFDSVQTSKYQAYQGYEPLDVAPRVVDDKGAGEPRLHVSQPVAAKPDGKKQPIDLYVDVTDETGKPVEGAKVMARVTDYENFVDAPLIDVGNGRYIACAFGYFNGKGKGATAIHIRAEAAGYAPGESDGTNDVGRLCSLPR